MVLFLQYLVNGLTLGSLYALIAIGYTMVYGVLKFINFSHGEVMMVGSYFCLLLYNMFVELLPLWPPLLLFLSSLVLAVMLAMLLGMVIERVAYRGLRGSPRLAALLSAVGVSIILANLVAVIWGTRSRNFPLPYPNVALRVGGLIITTHDLVIIVVSVILMLSLHIFVKYSANGKALRAVSLDTAIASVCGVNINRIITMTFAIGSGLAAIAGVLIAMRNSLDPGIGGYYGLKAFVASVIGGIGSVPGAMIGGLLLGVLEVFGGVLTGSYKETISFGVLILLLLFRPAGLLGQKTVDKV